MKLKTVEVNGTTYAEIQGDSVLLVDDAGKETALDAAYAVKAIPELKHEATSRRHAVKELEDKLKGFDGIDDPAAAIAALTTVQNLDGKKLIDAGEVEALKASITKAAEDKVTAAQEAAAADRSALHKEMIGGSFARSKFIADNLVVPSDIAQAAFGNRFDIQDGKVIATDAAGNQIYSASRPGEPATFDEALEQMVNAYPNKDTILKGRQQSGGGARPGGGQGGGRTMTRSEYDSMNPAQQRAVISEGATLTD